MPTTILTEDQAKRLTRVINLSREFIANAKKVGLDLNAAQTFEEAYQAHIEALLDKNVYQARRAVIDICASAKLIANIKLDEFVSSKLVSEAVILTQQLTSAYEAA